MRLLAVLALVVTLLSVTDALYGLMGRRIGMRRGLGLGRRRMRGRSYRNRDINYGFDGYDRGYDGGYDRGYDRGYDGGYDNGYDGYDRSYDAPDYGDGHYRSRRGRFY